MQRLLLLCCPLLALLAVQVSEAFLLPSSSLPASRHASLTRDTSTSTSTSSTALNARKKRTKEQDWYDIMDGGNGDRTLFTSISTYPTHPLTNPPSLPPSFHRMEVLKESGGLEEKEEGIWPTAPAPWEASFVGTTLDPLMLDPGREGGREGGGEGRVHGTEGKDRSTDLFSSIFIYQMTSTRRRWG